MGTMGTVCDCECTKGHAVLLSGGGFSQWPPTPEDENSSKTLSLNQPFSASVVAMAVLVERQGKNVALRRVEWRKDTARKNPPIQGRLNDRGERGWELPFLFSPLLFFFKIEKRTNIKEIIPPFGHFYRFRAAGLFTVVGECGGPPGSNWSAQMKFIFVRQTGCVLFCVCPCTLLFIYHE